MSSSNHRRPLTRELPNPATHWHLPLALANENACEPFRVTALFLQYSTAPYPYPYPVLPPCAVNTAPHRNAAPSPSQVATSPAPLRPPTDVETRLNGHTIPVFASPGTLPLRPARNNPPSCAYPPSCACVTCPCAPRPLTLDLYLSAVTTGRHLLQAITRRERQREVRRLRARAIHPHPPVSPRFAHLCWTICPCPSLPSESPTLKSWSLVSFILGPASASMKVPPLPSPPAPAPLRIYLTSKSTTHSRHLNHASEHTPPKAPSNPAS